MQSFSLDYTTGKPSLTLTLNERQEAVDIYETLKGYEKLSVEIKPYRPGRSLNANKYLWVLCEKLADKLQSTKEEIYRRCIKSVGVFRDISLPEEGIQTIEHMWNTYGTGWFAERVDFEQTKGEILLRCYYGSSVYNTKQMSRLIDELVEECKRQGIETLPPDELERLKCLWKGA